MLHDLLAAIETSPIAEAIGASAFAYPIVSAAHIVGIAVLFGGILMADLRLLGFFKRSMDDRLVELLVRFALAGFAICLLTGALLFSVQAVKYAGNPAFQIKLLLIGAAGANAMLLRFHGLRVPAAALSLGLWLSIILAGRWIAFA